MNTELIVFGIIFIVCVELFYWLVFRDRNGNFFLDKTVSVTPTIIILLFLKMFYELYKSIDFNNSNIKTGLYIILGVILFYGTNYIIHKYVKEKYWR